MLAWHLKVDGSCNEKWKGQLDNARVLAPQPQCCTIARFGLQQRPQPAAFPIRSGYECWRIGDLLAVLRHPS